VHVFIFSSLLNKNLTKKNQTPPSLSFCLAKLNSNFESRIYRERFAAYKTMVNNPKLTWEEKQALLEEEELKIEADRIEQVKKKQCACLEFISTLERKHSTLDTQKVLELLMDNPPVHAKNIPVT
jgi:hypothetical protein